MSPCTAVGMLSLFYLLSPQLIFSWFGKALPTKYFHHPRGPWRPQGPRVLTCHKITKAHCGESDHHKVNGLQGCPPLDVFENDGGDCHKHNAAGQDEQDG